LYVVVALSETTFATCSARFTFSSFIISVIQR
jgi:hypothetical protein